MLDIDVRSLLGPTARHRRSRSGRAACRVSPAFLGVACRTRRRVPARIGLRRRRPGTRAASRAGRRRGRGARAWARTARPTPSAIWRSGLPERQRLAHRAGRLRLRDRRRSASASARTVSPASSPASAARAARSFRRARTALVARRAPPGWSATSSIRRPTCSARPNWPSSRPRWRERYRRRRDRDRGRGAGTRVSGDRRRRARLGRAPRASPASDGRAAARSADAPLLSLCGKGVCFDTGGYDLKPSAGDAADEEGHGRRRDGSRPGALVMEADLPIRLAVRVGCVENSRLRAPPCARST